MVFQPHTYRLGVHGIFVNDAIEILQLKATYGAKDWGLPGGAIEPGETVHEALLRECAEELGVQIKILYMSGIYYHKVYDAHACIFRCELPKNADIILSSEHSAFRFFPLHELSNIQRQRVNDCLNYDGKVKSAKF